MKCFDSVINRCRKNKGKLDRAIMVRNNFIKCFEAFYFGLTILFIGFGIMMVASGVAFIRHDLWDNT